MRLKIPMPLKAEHEELHSELARAVMAKGRFGDAAKAVEVLYPAAILIGDYLRLRLKI